MGVALLSELNDPPLGDNEPRSPGRFRAWVAGHPVVVRWLLAGPGALIGAVLIMAAMPVWLPAGDAEVNHLVYPLILAPFIWALVFTYTVVEDNLARGVSVISGASVLSGVMIGAFMAFG